MGKPASVSVPESNIWARQDIWRLGMALFISAEGMFFAGLIGAFLVFRIGNANWPPAGQPLLPVGVTAINTIVLLLSAWPMNQAVRAIRGGRQHSLKVMLTATLFLGSIFLVVQGTEWIRLVTFGLTLTSSIYGGLFYTLIGVHALHVAAAVLALYVVLWKSALNEYSEESHIGIDLGRMYWNFVVGVWPILYVLVYLV